MTEAFVDHELKYIRERAAVIQYYVRRPPETRTALKRLVAAIAGRPWLDKPTCEHHQSPWDLIEAVYFDRASDVLAVGPRSGIKTQTVAMLNVLEMLTKPGIEIAHAGATKEQGERAHAWTRRYLLSPAMRLTSVTKDARMIAKTIELRNGSRVEVLTATTTGANSAHVNRLRLDEFELMKPDVIKELHAIPMSYGGHRRNLLRISSRKYRDGNVDRILRDRRYRSTLRVVWCWLDVSESCGKAGDKPAIIEVEDIESLDAPELIIDAWEGCRKCTLAPTCKGKAKFAKGWISIDDRIAEYLYDDRVTWLAQKCSQRPTFGEDRVFARFSRRRNIVDMEPTPGRPINLSVDFGGGRGMTAVLFWQEEPASCVRVLDELVIPSRSIDDDVFAVEQKLNSRFRQFKVGRAICDSAQPLIRYEWNARLQRCQLIPAKKASRKYEMVERLAALVSPPSGGTRYLVDPRCKTHIEQMMSFRFAYQQGSLGRTGYVDRNDDTVDAALYIAMDIAPAGPAPGATVIDLRTGALLRSWRDEPREFVRRKKGQKVVIDLKQYHGAVMRRLLES